MTTRKKARTGQGVDATPGVAVDSIPIDVDEYPRGEDELLHCLILLLLLRLYKFLLLLRVQLFHLQPQLPVPVFLMGTLGEPCRSWLR